MIPWQALISALVQFLFPLILKWLQDILSNQVAAKFAVAGTSPPAHPAQAIHDVFTAARGELYVWQFAKRAALRACERVALGRADELVAAAAGKTRQPLMNTAEIEAATAGL